MSTQLIDRSVVAATTRAEQRDCRNCGYAGVFQCHKFVRKKSLAVEFNCGTDRAAWLPIQPKTLLGAIYTASDRGPWHAEVDPLMGHARIASDDATHDVVLRVDGNFKTLDEKRAYTEDIARRLNDSTGPLSV